MVREPRIVLASEAMKMGINDRGTPIGGFRPEMADQERYGSGLEELASVHGGFLPEDGWGNTPRASGSG
jgi:hypothetical protein